MKLLVKMKNVSFILWKKLDGLFGQPDIKRWRPFSPGPDGGGCGVSVWEKAAQKDSSFLIKRQHFDPSSPHETSLSGPHCMNFSPTMENKMQSCRSTSPLIGVGVAIL